MMDKFDQFFEQNREDHQEMKQKLELLIGRTTVLENWRARLEGATGTVKVLWCGAVVGITLFTNLLIAWWKR